MALYSPHRAGTCEPAAFNPFPRLPPELRRKIWKLAICTDDSPRIHYYNLFNDDNGGQRKSSLQQMMKYYHSEPRETLHPMGIPNLENVLLPRTLWSRPSEFSWTKESRFVYLWNAGLNTACWESRVVLLEYSARRPLPPRKCLVAHQEPDVYLAIYPKRDVVCFRFAPEDMDACVSMQWDVILPRLPFFHLPYASDINLALEFDDSWNEGLEITRSSMLKFLREPSPRGLAMRAHWAWMLGDMPRWARMWLIDRGGGLPDDYELPTDWRKDDDRYSWCLAYRTDRFPCEPEKRHFFFIDGKNRYVESDTWAGQRRRNHFSVHVREVPLLSFMWKVRWLCLPSRSERRRNRLDLPFGSEQFFRVLRQMHLTEPVTR